MNFSNTALEFLENCPFWDMGALDMVFIWMLSLKFSCTHVWCDNMYKMFHMYFKMKHFIQCYYPWFFNIKENSIALHIDEKKHNERILTKIVLSICHQFHRKIRWLIQLFEWFVLRFNTNPKFTSVLSWH